MSMTQHRRITGKLVIATHNPGKLAEMRELLAPHGVEAVSAGELGLGEPEETGNSFRANAEIKAREIVVIVWVHLTLLLFVWISFRSLAAVVCIITPLVLCSLLTYGGMATIGVGMKAATLPVAAFGVGTGVGHAGAGSCRRPQHCAHLQGAPSTAGRDLEWLLPRRVRRGRLGQCRRTQ